MGREQTLLKRLAALGEGGGSRTGATASEDVGALMESVREHLGRLLNARHGMCEALPDYGLPALNDLVVGSGDYTQLVEEAIRTTVEQYEPRLRRVRVTRLAEEEESQSKKLAFRVDAMLVGRSGQHRVWYQTEVTGAGDFEVSD